MAGYTNISVNNSSSSQVIELTDRADPTSQTLSAEPRVTVNNSGAENNADTSSPTGSDIVTPDTSNITGAIERPVALRMLQVSLNEVTDEEALQEENNIDSLDGYNGSIGDITTGQLFEVNNEAVRNEEQNNRNRNEFVEYLWYAATTVDLGDPATGRISPIRDEDLSR